MVGLQDVNMTCLIRVNDDFLIRFDHDFLSGVEYDCMMMAKLVLVVILRHVTQ